MFNSLETPVELNKNRDHNESNHTSSILHGNLFDGACFVYLIYLIVNYFNIIIKIQKQAIETIVCVAISDGFWQVTAIFCLTRLTLLYAW